MIKLYFSTPRTFTRLKYHQKKVVFETQKYSELPDKKREYPSSTSTERITELLLSAMLHLLTTHWKHL